MPDGNIAGDGLHYACRGREDSGLFRHFGGQMDDEVGAAGLRGKVNGSAVLLDDAMDDAKPKSCADANGLGGVEGIEDVSLDIKRDAAAVIADPNA